MRHPLPVNRIVRGATDAAIVHQFHDADGDAAAPSGAVTVAVTRSDGTAVTVGAVTGTGTGPRSVTIGVAELGVVDQLTAVWSDGGTPAATDTIDVVGGTIGSVATIQAVEPSLSQKAAADVSAARSAVEARFASTEFRSPVPRLTVERVDGTGRDTLKLTWPDLIEVRWARVWTSATAFTTLTAEELASIIVPDVMSEMRRLDGQVWPCGRSNIEIAYVFGLTEIPLDLRDALFHAVRAQISRTTTGVPDKAIGWASADGINFQIATPGQRGAIWGIPDIDDVWNRYMDPRPKVA